MRWWWVWAMVLLAGCGLAERTAPSTQETASAQARSEATPQIPASVPPVDTSRHAVPLERVYFNTFQSRNGAVPLSEAPPGLIERLRDAIPPLHYPEYEAAEEAGWLEDEDIVIGYSAGGQAWAYPVRILNFHEIVNDRLDGEPVLISYCPLCYSGIAFSRQLGERVLSFGNTSALYESDLVMLDYETGSYWWQVAGQAIVGELTGEQLAILPSMTVPWGEWRALHPSTLVLSRETGHERGGYERDPFAGYAEMVDAQYFAFPVSRAGRDPRLSPAARVLAVSVGYEVRAYPLDALGRAAIMDRLDDQDIVVFVDADGPAGAAYEPVADGRKLSFERLDGDFVDRETGSSWSLAGRAVAGPLQGAQLHPLPTRTSFWFAIVAAEPEITVYDRSGE